jgi:hypothetical protein
MKSKALAVIFCTLLIIVTATLLTVHGVSPQKKARAASARKKKPCADAKVKDEAGEQTGAIPKGKMGRTPAQNKLDTQLLYALKQKRGETRGVPTGRIILKLDERGRVLVDISARVSPALVAEIEKLGGAVISQSETYHTIRARVALEQLEALASLEDVRFIMPAADAFTNGAATN